jgi:serine/threonine protein kinase
MQAVPVDQLVGKTIGEYQVERLLGSGKSSAVYLARQLTQNNTVTITTFVIPETFSAQAHARFMARFVKVGSSLVELRHQHILPTFAVGEEFGYPYLVTSFMQGGSLAQLLKRQPLLTPERTLGLLKQVAAALDFAHSKGVIHGTLSPAHILIGGAQGMQGIQVAGFGLLNMLQMAGIDQDDHPYPYLFGITDSFLGTPEYVAPERVQGGPVDGRADIYSLGIILFELLSGTLLSETQWSAYRDCGADPLEVAIKRVQPPVVSLHESFPDVPIALDIVIQRALEIDPTRRFQLAGEVAVAFERVLKVLSAAEKAPAVVGQLRAWDSEMTLPPNVNWFDEEMAPGIKMPVMPPDITRAPAGNVSSSRPAAMNMADNVDTMDPFAWWSASAARTQVLPPRKPATTVRIGGAGPVMRGRPAPAMKQRRQLLALLVAGGVMGALGVSGIALAEALQSRSTQSVQTTNIQPSPSTSSNSAGTPTTTSNPTSSPTQQPKAKSTPTATSRSTPASAPTPTPRPTSAPRPAPTPRPTPTPKPKGNVIGNTSMPANSATSFTNPSDGNASLLIHLADSSFVACERACTHAGVNVSYDSSSQQLVCPAHGATFDPKNGFSPTPPAPGPLPSVSIHVNSDGTITVG